jgi:hypothetical protein
MVGGKIKFSEQHSAVAGAGIDGREIGDAQRA